jgi:hypothetical protein
MARPLSAWCNRARNARASGDMTRSMALKIEDALSLQDQADALRNLLASIEEPSIRKAIAGFWATDLVRAIQLDEKISPSDLGTLATRPAWKKAMRVDKLLQFSEQTVESARILVNTTSAAFADAEKHSFEAQADAPKRNLGTGVSRGVPRRDTEDGGWDGSSEASDREATRKIMAAHKATQDALGALEASKLAQRALDRATTMVAIWKAWKEA